MVSTIAIGSKSFIFSPLLEKPYSPLVVINIRNEVRGHAINGTNNVNFSAENLKDFTWLHHSMNNYPKLGRKFIPIVPEDGFNRQICRSFGPSGDDISQTRNAVLNGIIQALKSNNENLIGVYGSDSLRKAELLQRLCNRARMENLFDQYVLVKVTSKPNIAAKLGLNFKKAGKPNIENIQDTIAANLGLHFKKAGKRADQLRDHLKDYSRILICLCDLPRGVDLRKIGIPVGSEHPGCKIVVTSKSRDVLAEDMNAHQIYEL